MMKRSINGAVVVLILLLGFAMVLSLTACGGNDETDASEVESASPEVEATAPEIPEADPELPPYTVDMTSDELWTAYKGFSESMNLSDITLEKLQDFIGVDAEKSDEQSDTWVKYQWYTTDGGGLILLLNKDTGAFISTSQAYPPTP